MDDMQWVRPPKQERSQRTLELFLDTVEALHEEQAVETVSVKDIAARADLSVGGFYSRFPNREAVLRAVHARFAVEAKATIDVALAPARWAAVPMIECVPKLVGFLADDYKRRPGLRRAFLALNGTDAEVRARSQEVSGYVAGRFHGFLASKAHEIEHDDLMLASDIIHRMLFSMLDSYVLFGRGSSTGRSIQHDVFCAELARAVGRYLRVKPAGDRAEAGLLDDRGTSRLPAADPVTPGAPLPTNDDMPSVESEDVVTVPVNKNTYSGG